MTDENAESTPDAASLPAQPEAADTYTTDERLTLTWQTMGIEDRPLGSAPTISLRPDQTLQRPPDAAGLLDQLPRLAQHSDRKTLPDLKLGETLGEGGMGIVMLAEQLSVGREVAVKRVRPDHLDEHSTLVLLREGWTTGLLEHPNIVPIYTLGRGDDGHPMIVMKKIEGTSWLEILDDPDLAPDAFDADDPLEMHLEILIQICNAVSFAHDRGIIHRDLKPENIMLGGFGEVYLLDWGIAACIDDRLTDRLLAADEVSRPAGTPAYMAPEMVTTDGPPLGIHTDIFLLGAILHELLTGRPPYDGSTLFAVMLRAHDCEPPTFDDDAPRELVAICRRAMARDPRDRFDDVREFREALVDFRRGRAARLLAEKADGRQQELARLLHQEEETGELDEHALYRVFGECRFAYEQSLEINPNTPQATKGLQDILEAMAHRELNHDAPKAASLLISEFPEPRPDIERRLKKLTDRLAHQRQDYEDLQRIRRNVDVNVGKRSRAIFILIMGLIWTFFAVALALIMQFRPITIPPWAMLAHIAFVTGLLGAVVYGWRGFFFQNEVNRRMLIAVVGTFVCTSILRIMAFVMELSTVMGLTIESLMYGLSTLVVGITLERRVGFVSIPWLVCALGGAIWPAALYWLFAAANAATVALLTILWWPSDGDAPS